MENGKRPLPEGWRWARLRDVSEDQTGTRDPRVEPGAPFRYIDITSVDNVSKRIVAPKTVLGRDAPSRARQTVRVHDVLVATTRPNLNAVALVPAELDKEICSTGFCVLRPKAALCPDYLFGFVRSKKFVETLSGCVRGAMYPAVTDSQVRDVEIPLPPLPEQKRIAAILNEQMAAVERARAAAEARLEAAKALPAAYLRAVFESPKAQTWPALPIGSLGDASRGDTVQTGPFGAQLPSAEFTPTGVPVLNIGNVQWGYLDLSRLDHVTPQRAAALERYTVREGDLLFTRSGTIGRCCIVPGSCRDWLISYHLLRVAFDRDKVCPDFAAATLRGSEGVRGQLRLLSGRGATRDGVNSTILAELRIPVPPLSEQKSVAAIFKEQAASAERLRRAIQDESDAANRLPAALLRRAFSGEL